MPQLQERVNIAVFIDFDNIEIGVKTTLGEHFDIGTILEALKERGEVVTKVATPTGPALASTAGPSRSMRSVWSSGT